MKKLLRIALVVIIGLFVLGFVAYRLWFYNPYHDALRLHPVSIFSEGGSSAGLLIRNATLIDVVAGKAIPHTSLLIQGDPEGARH